MKTRAAGTGAIINRKGTANLYIRYWHEGRQIQEAVGSDSQEDAEQMLQDRMSESRKGAVPAQDIKQLRYEDIRASYVKQKPSRENDHHLLNLDAFFGGKRVNRITTDLIEEFIEERREDASDPTIRRDLNPLRAMFHIAQQKKQLGMRDIPHFPMPEDSAPAGEYIEPEQFANILSHLPTNLQPLYTFMYSTGCRLGAAQKITWEMVNEKCDVLTLPAEIIKTRKPLLLVLDGPVLAPIAAALRKQFRQVGQPVFDSTNYRKAWAKAVAAAGLGEFDNKTCRRDGVRIHDCRCSGAINLLDSGVDEGTVLKIGGWKTRTMLDRYNVQNEKRIRAAMVRVGEFVTGRMASATK